MRRRARLLPVWIGLLLLVPAPTGAAPPDSYSAAEIRGWVIDAETTQPLEGVHVVAQWILNTGMFFHSRRVNRLHIMETVTDARGEFYFPAWGPTPRPTFSSLDTADPRLTFFKPGYRALDRSNRIPHDGALRTSVWHGETIGLQPFRGTPEEWASHLVAVQIGLDWGSPLDTTPPQINDYWKSFPRMVLAILDQKRTLPTDLGHRVWDLKVWNVTEEQLRSLIQGTGVRR
jgi:hypothetical protein